MKFYRYESSKDTGCWLQSKSKALKEYEEEKDYLMADEVDEDECVKLVSIEIPDELIIDLEDETKEEKLAMLIRDPDRMDEDPREDGWDYDYYVGWSDDIENRKSSSTEQ